LTDMNPVGQARSKCKVAPGLHRVLIKIGQLYDPGKVVGPQNSEISVTAAMAAALNLRYGRDCGGMGGVLASAR
jgi:hypothetical protein